MNFLQIYYLALSCAQLIVVPYTFGLLQSAARLFGSSLSSSDLISVSGYSTIHFSPLLFVNRLIYHIVRIY